MSLSDEASADIASKLCGQVRKIKGAYTINETSRRSGINLMSAQAGGGQGSVGASKSFQERARGAVSAARLRLARELSGDLSPLRRRAVAPAKAGVPQAALPSRHAPILERETSRTALNDAAGLERLNPCRPGLEAALDDPDRSDIMIHGLGNMQDRGTRAAVTDRRCGRDDTRKAFPRGRASRPGTWPSPPCYVDDMDKVRIEADLPAALAAQARAFVAEGCATDLDDLPGGSASAIP